MIFRPPQVRGPPPPPPLPLCSPPVREKMKGTKRYERKRLGTACAGRLRHSFGLRQSLPVSVEAGDVLVLYYEVDDPRGMRLWIGTTCLIIKQIAEWSELVVFNLNPITSNLVPIVSSKIMFRKWGWQSFSFTVRRTYHRQVLLELFYILNILYTFKINIL